MRAGGRVRIAAGLALVGLVPRLINLGQRPIWYDEAFSVLLARGTWAQIVRGTAADTMPPLYYFLLSLWMNLVDGMAGLRLLNVLLGGLCVALVYLWVAEVVRERAARVAGLLAALSPFLIYHSQELRMYTLLLLGSLLYGLGTARLLRTDESDGAERGSIRSWLLFVGGATVAMYSHNLAVFTLVAPALLLLIQRRWTSLQRLSWGWGAILILAAPWLAILPRQIAKIQAAFWTPTPGPLEVIQAFVTFHTNLPVPDWAIPVALTGSLLTGALVGYSVLSAPAQRPQLSQLWIFLLAPPLALFAASYLMRPVFVPRAFIFSSVAYLGIVGWAAVQQRLPGLKYVLLATALIPALLVLPAQYTYREFPRSPFDRAASFLMERVEPGSIVVHDNKLSFFPMHVYAPDVPMEFIRDEPGSHNDTLAPETQEVMGLDPAPDIESAVHGRSTVWFVVFDRAVEEYRELGHPDHPRVEWLRNHYVQDGAWQFNDLTLMRFVAG